MNTILVIALLMCATSAVIWGSVLALQLGRLWGYVCNTTGIIGFWVAAFLPHSTPPMPHIADKPAMEERAALISVPIVVDEYEL